MNSRLPRTQAHSSGFESDWDFGFALGIMEKSKRKTRLADYDFKKAESNLCKTIGKEKEPFRVFFSEGKVHQLVLKGKIPCPHNFYEKDPHVFRKKWHFPAFSCGSQMYLRGRNLARELGS